MYCRSVKKALRKLAPPLSYVTVSVTKKISSFLQKLYGGRELHSGNTLALKDSIGATNVHLITRFFLLLVSGLFVKMKREERGELLSLLFRAYSSSSLPFSLLSFSPPPHRRPTLSSRSRQELQGESSAQKRPSCTFPLLFL